LIWAFDADVLIYAADPSHSLGQPVRRLLAGLDPGDGVGSVLLVPELLIKPTRIRDEFEIQALLALLARLQLIDLTSQAAFRATNLGVAYGLKSIDAVHLATALLTGATGFLTNNRSDFGSSLIRAIDVVYPADL
jgi:predicted nucleic acid-binding protein